MFLYFIVAIITYILRPLFFDLPMNLFYLIKTDENDDKIKKELQVFKFTKSSKFATLKDIYLSNKFSYKTDPLGGLIDWCPRHILVMITRKYKDDCDGFAAMASFIYPNEGKRYMLVPLNPKHFLDAHIIFVRENKIYSSGQIHTITLEEYMDKIYKYKNAIILRYL